jgi:DNA-binding MurR/RpiR family transcriptional regulator
MVDYGIMPRAALLHQAKQSRFRPAGQSLRQFIIDRYPGLGPKQQAVTRFLLDHQDQAAFASIYAVAAASGADVSTVVRVAKNLGLAGYPQLRRELRQEYLRGLRPPDLLTESPLGHRPETATVRQEIKNLHDLNETLNAARIAAAGRMLMQARRILVIGTGTHAVPGIVLAHLGEGIGLPIDLETHTGPLLAPRIAGLTPRDVLVVVGFWRVAREIVEAAHWARLHRVPTLAITDSSFSPLAEADMVLMAPTESVSFFQSMTAPLAVTYAVLAWIMSRDPQRARARLAMVQEVHEKFMMHWKQSAEEAPRGPNDER